MDIAWIIFNLMSWVASPMTIPINTMGGKSSNHFCCQHPGWQVLSDKVHSEDFFSLGLVTEDSQHFKLG
jgi:hypothetical protein